MIVIRGRRTAIADRNSIAHSLSSVESDGERNLLVLPHRPHLCAPAVKATPGYSVGSMPLQEGLACGYREPSDRGPDFRG
jgi:hypothetical protein